MTSCYIISDHSFYVKRPHSFPNAIGWNGSLVSMVSDQQACDFPKYTRHKRPMRCLSELLGRNWNAHAWNEQELISKRSRGIEHLLCFYWNKATNEGTNGTIKVQGAYRHRQSEKCDPIDVDNMMFKLWSAILDAWQRTNNMADMSARANNTSTSTMN